MSKEYVIVTGSDGGFGNLGDEWLLDSAKDRYQQLKRKYRVVILKGNIPSFSFDGFKYIKDNPESFAKANIPLDKIKAVHYYGGGYLNKFWMHEKLWLYDQLVRQGFPSQKVFFTGQGLGPFTDEQLTHLKKVSSDVGFFGVRDECFSDEIRAKFMFDESVHLISAKKKNKKSNRILLNLRIAEHVGADEGRLGQLLTSLHGFSQDSTHELRLFSMIKGKTFQELPGMKKLLESQQLNLPITERPRGFKELMESYKGAALIVTTSYHATLAAIYTGTPVVAVYENDYYDYKFKGLEKALDTPLLHLLNLQELSKFNWADALNSSDNDISSKVEKLKLVNDNGYESLLGLLNE